MNLIFLGPPGAGKGTQAINIARKYGLIHLSTGDMLRAEVKTGSPIGKKIENILGTGGLSDDAIVIEVLSKYLSRDDVQKGFIMDGFPRTLNQAIELDSILKAQGCELDYVINLAVEDKELVDRIVGRYACAVCGAGYHEQYLKPQVENRCDKCGSQDFKRRQDDNAQVLGERLKNYHAEMQGILDYYSKKGLLTQVDALGDITEVQQHIEAVWKGNPKQSLEG